MSKYPVRQSKSEVVKRIQVLLDNNPQGLSRAEIIEDVLHNVAGSTSITCNTYITDGFNEKYCLFSNLLKKEPKTGLIVLSK